MLFRKKVKLVVFSVCVTVLLSLGTVNSQRVGSSLGEKLSIKLKAKALVIGPTIRLGDIGNIVIPDSLKRMKVEELEIGMAPPPGESTEISLGRIKKRLQAAGFAELMSIVKGPSIIRVTTAQAEIDKAVLKEEYACQRQGASLPRKRTEAAPDSFFQLISLESHYLITYYDLINPASVQMSVTFKHQIKVI